MRMFMSTLLLVTVGCELDQRCIDSDNCPDNKVCLEGLCVIDDGEGEEGEGEEGEGEEGEGEEGEGEEGEGEEGESEEGEGEVRAPCPPATSVCRNGVVEFGEQCDDRNDNDEDGCTLACRFHIIRCGISVPLAFLSNGVVTGEGVEVDPADPGCSPGVFTALLTQADV